MRVGTVIVVAGIIGGCAATRPALTSPAEGGPAWVELTTPSFVLCTDLAEDDAREVSAELERIERAERVFVDLAESSHKRTTRVVIVARKSDYEAIGRPDADGDFRAATADAFSTPTIVFHGAFNQDIREIFQHELAHRLMREAIAFPPRWLTEGFAQYMQTMELRGGKLFLGKTDTLALRLPRDYEYRMGSFRPVPLAELLTADRPAFERRVGDAYFTSAVFVHMLLGASYRERFGRYLAALIARQPGRDAWRAGFGDLAVEQLQRDFDAYVMSPSLDYRETAYEPAPPPAPKVRPMTDAEVHLLWASLRSWRGSLEPMKHDVDVALKDPASRADARFWAARIAARERRWKDAERELQQALAERPQDERLNYALVALHYTLATATRSQRSLEPEVRALVPLATHVETLNFIAWYYAEEERPDDGLPPARRAVGEDPTCAACLDTLALLTFQKGNVAGAVQYQERALGMLPDGASVAAMEARLVHYRDALEHSSQRPK